MTLSALATTSYGLSVSSLPVWTVEGGGTEAEAGGVVSAMLLCAVATQAVVPRATARFGTRRLIAAGCALMSAPALLMARSQDVSWLMASAACRGVGFAFVIALGTRAVADLAAPSRRGEALGAYGAATALPLLVAVPGGAALALAGRCWLAAVVSAIPVLGVIGARQLPPELDVRPTGPGSGDLRFVSLPPIVLLLLVTVPRGGVIAFLPGALDDKALAAACLFIVGIAMVIGRLLAGYAVDHGALPWLLWAGPTAAGLGLLIAAGVLALGLQHGGTGTELIAAFALFGVAIGAVQNVSLLLALERAAPNAGTSASAAWNATADAGMGIGAFVTGLALSAGLSLQAGLAAGGVLAFLAVPAAALDREARERGGYPTEETLAERDDAVYGRASGTKL